MLFISAQLGSLSIAAIVPVLAQQLEADPRRGLTDSRATVTLWSANEGRGRTAFPNGKRHGRSFHVLH
jgi:hypothetical protein